MGSFDNNYRLGMNAVGDERTQLGISSPSNLPSGPNWTVREHILSSHSSGLASPHVLKIFLKSCLNISYYLLISYPLFPFEMET
jgi:hypothetical protein